MQVAAMRRTSEKSDQALGTAGHGEAGYADIDAAPSVLFFGMKNDCK
jgi:hypothetical protein